MPESVNPNSWGESTVFVPRRFREPQVVEESLYSERGSGGLGHGDYDSFDEAASQKAMEAREQADAVAKARHAVQESFGQNYAG